ncbi:MAG: type II toxin-antitoxin system RelE/ParE family toxin [Terriglobales bacterium]
MGIQARQWRCFEVLEAATGKRPVSAALVKAGGEATTALRIMQRLETFGWPRAELEYKFEGKRRVVKTGEDGVWLLKCKTSCWRIYFYVDQNEARFVFLHAKCKKKDKEDAQDARTAAARLGKLFARSGQIAEFPFPAA